MNRPAHDEAKGDECDCFRCHVDSIQVSPSATPSRRNSVASRTPNNSWERGVPKDSRGMPYLDDKGHEIGQKRWVETERRKFTDAGLA